MKEEEEAGWRGGGGELERDLARALFADVRGVFQSRMDNAKAEAYLCSWRSGLSGSWTLKVKGNEP